MGIAHHDWNQLCGYAWSKDKEEDRTLIETAMHFGLIKHAKRKVSITSIGEEVIYKLLGYNPENHTLSGIPILIDVKHMNLQSRIRYYDMLCDIKNHTGKNIPIIISHVAASGLSLDRTFFNNNKSFSKSFTQDRSDSCMFPYKPKEDAGFGSFSDEKLISKNASKKNLPYVGWLYPWLLNLSDEEINRIFDSDGLIGIMIDQRPLGRSMVNYYSEAFCDVSEKSLRYDTLYNNGDQTKLNKELYDLIHTSRSTKKKEKRNYEDIIRKKLYIEDWSSYVGIKSKELSIKTFKNNENTELIPEFLEIEPFLRNIFYIVENSGISNSTAWNHICFGSDFDGWINPVDPVPLASDVNHLKMLIKIYLPHFVKQNSWTALNGNIYCDNPLDFKSNLRMHEKALLLLDSNIDKATDKFINKFFHDNALRVIEKYYGKNWNEIKND
jgi:microsomal dipeptidase-like Zn-dependent dipeptidase